MATQSNFPPEPTVPCPPRFWWLKRIAVAVTIALLGLIALRLWWGHAAAVRVRALVDAAHARGAPILPADFAPEPLAENENAAATLALAAASIVTDANFDAIAQTWNGGPFTPPELAQVDAIAAKNQRALQLARLARSQPRADWGLQICSPAISIRLPHLSSQRQLARLQEWIAQRDHERGRDGDALGHVRDLLREADAIDQGPQCVVTHLTALALVGLTTDLVEQIASDLHVAKGGPASSRSGAAAPEQIRAVIQGLIDERSLRTAGFRSWQGERMMVLDSGEHGPELLYAMRLLPRGSLRFELWLIRPAFLLDGIRLAGIRSQIAHAASRPNWPQAAAGLPQKPGNIDSSGLGQLAHPLDRVMSMTADRALRTHFQMLAERRAAAIELALCLYRLHHNGLLPAKLPALVPDYLPSLPADPMAGDGHGFCYHSATHPPVIYSVGENGVDDGGTRLPDGTPQGFRWNLPDAVFPLEPIPPSTQPSSAETQDDQ
jgi:hypothetical protein